MEYIFSFTATVCILNVFAMMSIACGNPIRWPGLLYFYVKPTDFYLMYPSVFYQVYYWHGVYA